MKVTYLPIDDLIVPDYVERAADRVEDDLLRKSVERGGIQQPFLIVTPPDGRKILADGLTRLRIARVLSFSSVPCVFDPLPDGEDLERYVKRVRFIVNFHRQDLLPSQEAELIEYFKREPFNMTHKEIAKHLGIAPDSVTNALSIKFYIGPVAKAVDAGQLTRHAARVFDGLSEKGQKTIWKEHGKELASTPGGVIHAQLRQRYSPEKHPDFYRQPELIAQRLKRKKGNRRGQARPNMSTKEKLGLMSRVAWEEGELRMFQAESERYDRRRDATIIPARQIVRDQELSEMLSPDMTAQLQKWYEIYC